MCTKMAAKVIIKNQNMVVQVEQGLNFIGYQFKDRSTTKNYC